MNVAIGLADSWAAPILTANSEVGALRKHIETVVLKRERKAPPFLAFVSSLIRGSVEGEGRSLVQSKQLKAELVRLKMDRQINEDTEKRTSDEGTLRSGGWNHKESLLVAGYSSLVRAVPSRVGLANKAFLLMVIAAGTVCLETAYRSCNIVPLVSPIRECIVTSYNPHR